MVRGLAGVSAPSQLVYAKYGRNLVSADVVRLAGAFHSTVGKWNGVS